MDSSKFKEFKNYYSNNPIEFYENFTNVKLSLWQKILLKILYKKEKINNIRSESYKRMINEYDTPVQLIRKEDGEIFEPFYLNCYGKVYFFDENDNLIFMTEEALDGYEISYCEGEIE